MRWKPASADPLGNDSAESALPGGGYIYHSDHSVPKNISFEQYCRVIDLVHKYGQY